MLRDPVTDLSDGEIPGDLADVSASMGFWYSTYVVDPHDGVVLLVRLATVEREGGSSNDQLRRRAEGRVEQTGHLSRESFQASKSPHSSPNSSKGTIFPGSSPRSTSSASQAPPSSPPT